MKLIFKITLTTVNTVAGQINARPQPRWDQIQVRTFTEYWLRRERGRYPERARTERQPLPLDHRFGLLKYVKLQERIRSFDLTGYYITICKRRWLVGVRACDMPLWCPITHTHSPQTIYRATLNRTPPAAVGVSQYSMGPNTTPIHATAQSKVGFRLFESWDRGFESRLSEYFKLHNEILFICPSTRRFHLRT